MVMDINENEKETLLIYLICSYGYHTPFAPVLVIIQCLLIGYILIVSIYCVHVTRRNLVGSQYIMVSVSILPNNTCCLLI